MGLFTIDRTDHRLTDISRDRYDCFMFDMFTMREFNRIISGQSVILDRFILEHSNEEESLKRNKHILSKVRTIRNITRNNTNSNTFLVFQTISWKSTKNKMPYILIPVRIYDDGTKIVRNGEITINPQVLQDIDLGTFKVPKRYKDFQSLDSPELAKIIEGENGRILYEMYLTHFKIEYIPVPHTVDSVFERTLPVDKITNIGESLFVLDRESETVRSLVQSGKSVIIDTIKGTNRHPLIADLLYDGLNAGKSILFLSESDNTYLHDFLVTSRLNQFIDDDSDTRFTEKRSNLELKQITDTTLTDIKSQIESYQDVMRSDNKSFQLNNLMRDYYLLEEFEDKRIIVERLDDLTNQDIQMIRRTLRQVESSIRKLKTTKPADSHWNDLELRALRGITKEFVQKIVQTSHTMTELQGIRQELVNRFGLKLASNIEDLYVGIQHNEHVRSDLFPDVWYDSAVFQEVKDSLISAGNIVGRAYSLRHTLMISYKEEILHEDLHKPFEAITNHKYFSLDLEENNRLINNEMTIQDNMNQLYEYAKDWVRAAKDLEEFHEIPQNKEFHQKVIDFNFILTHPLMKKRWFQMEQTKLERVLEILNERNDLLVAYMHLRKELKDVLEETISEVDDDILHSYQNALKSKSVFRFKPEYIYSEKIVTKHVKDDYNALSKSLKSYLMDRAIEWKALKQEAQPLLNEIQETLGVKLTIHELDDLRKIVQILLCYEWESIHLLYSDEQIQRLKKMDETYQKIVEGVKEYLEESELSYLYTTSLDELRENYSTFKEYLLLLSEAKKQFLSYFKNDLKTITIQTMRSITHTCTLFHKSNQELLDHNQEFERLYSIFYQGINTNFKNIRERIQLFEELKELFVTEEDLRIAFQTGAMGIIRGAIQSLVVQLEILMKQLDDVERFFTHGFPSDELEELYEYLELFVEVELMDQWIVLMDDFQRLRNYFQLRLVALINTGVLTNHFVKYFERSLYQSLLLQMDERTDSEPYLKLNDFYNSVHQTQSQNVSNLQTRKFKNRIQMSSIYAFDLFENKEFDLLIIDSAEKVHQNVIKQISGHMHQLVVLFDSSEPAQFDTIPRYLVKYPVFRLQNNYAFSLYAHEARSKGVVYEQKHVMLNKEELLAFVLNRIQTENHYVNVVCSLQAFRLTLFDQINDAVYAISTSNEEYLHYIEHIHILLAGEYHPRSDVTILFYDDLLDAHVNRILLNTKELVIIDEQHTFIQRDIYKKLSLPEEALYLEVDDPFLVKVIHALRLEGVTIKKAFAPFDFIIFRETGSKVLLKIAYHEKENSDILEDALMMYHPSYQNYEKIVVTVGDLHYRKDETIKKIREMIHSGYRK